MKKKRRALFKYFQERADIICLQETHSAEDIEKIWTTEWGGKIYFEHADSTSKGVCILVNKCTKFEISKIIFKSEGRLIICQATINDANTVCLVNLYAPNKDTPAFFELIKDKLKDTCEQKILIGDFNLALDNDRDRMMCTTNNDKSKEKVQDIMNQYLLSDTWRE